MPVSGPEELTLAKTKVAVEKEKIEQEIEEDVQKAKKIAQLVQEIERINEKIIYLILLDVYNFHGSLTG